MNVKNILFLFLLIFPIFAYKIYINVYPSILSYGIQDNLDGLQNFYSLTYEKTPTFIYIYYEGTSSKDNINEICIYPCELMESKNYCVKVDLVGYKDYSFSYYTKFKKEGLCNLKIKVGDDYYSYLINVLPIEIIDINPLIYKINTFDGILNFKLKSNIFLKKCIFYLNSSKNILIYNNPIIINNINTSRNIFIKYKKIDDKDSILNINGFCLDLFNNKFNITKTILIKFNEIINEIKFDYNPKIIKRGKINKIEINFPKLDWICYKVLNSQLNINKLNDCTKSNKIVLKLFVENDYDKNNLIVPIEIKYKKENKIFSNIIKLIFWIYDDYLENTDVIINYDSIKCNVNYCMGDINVYNFNDRKIKYLKLIIDKKIYIFQNIEPNDFDFTTIKFKRSNKLEFKLCDLYNNCKEKIIYIDLPPIKKEKSSLNLYLFLIFGLVIIIIIIKKFKKF